MSQAIAPDQDGEIEARKRSIIANFALRRLLIADFNERNHWGERAIALGFPKKNLCVAGNIAAINPWVGVVAQEMFDEGLLIIDFAKELANEPAPQKQTAQIIQLPLWPEAVRAVPNDILRSALFAAIQGKDRKLVKNAVIASQDDFTVTLTGELFDQSDLSVWEQILHFARQYPLGTVCHVTGYGLLKALGHCAGKKDYVWLHSVVQRLRGNTVEIIKGKSGLRKIYGGGLISDYCFDEITGAYKLELNQKLLVLYTSGWSGINFEQRKALTGKPLALWLQGYYATHAKPYPVKVETLRELCGSKAKILYNFRQQLRQALDNLKAIGVIASWTIDPVTDLVTVDRGTAIADSQHKHLELTKPKRQRKPKSQPKG